MTSVLNVDSIAAKDGTSPVELTKQQASKGWLNWNTVTSHSTRDSFNVSSLTDITTGQTTISYTSSMSDINYQSMFFTNASNGVAIGSFANAYAGSNAIVRASSSCACASYDASAYTDASQNDWSILGDLA